MSFAITDGRPQFAPVGTYYGMFPQEVTKSGILPVRSPVLSIEPRTFQGLVFSLNMYAYQRQDKDAVVVVHGHTSPSGPDGLSIPLNERTNMLATEEAFDDLYQMLNNRLNYQQIGKTDEATLGSHTQTIQGVKVKLRVEPGTLEQVFNVLVQIRYREMNSVEIRACNLGLNPRALTTLGRLLGVKFISAPNTHMFYVRVDTGRKMTLKGFNQWARDHRGCRVFRNGGNSDDALAVRVNGQGPFRSTEAATTSSNLNWFVKSFIMKDSSFSGNTGFVLEGMDHDSSVKPFVLPLDAEYRDHIVQVGPFSSLEKWMKGYDEPATDPVSDVLGIPAFTAH